MKDEKPKRDLRYCWDTDGVELRAVEADDGSVKISGYAYRFNSWSEDLGGFRERIKPGAGQKALLKSDVRLLYNHDSNTLPLGRTPKTLRLAEDTKGLKFEGDLPDTQFARDLAIAIERKDITGNSFSFLVAEGGDEWKEKEGVASRTISEFDEFFDIGPVVFPAYDSAKVKVSQRTLENLEKHKTGLSSRSDEGVTALLDEQANLKIDLLKY